MSKMKKVGTYWQDHRKFLTGVSYMLMYKITGYDNKEGQPWYVILDHEGDVATYTCGSTYRDTEITEEEYIIACLN